MNLFGLVKNRACRRLRILLCGHPVLRRRSEPVPAITADIRLLACRMIATMVESDVVGVGLAAPQVGTNLRLIVLGTHDPE
ncbi:MAG: peptide deformylase, partial [Lentisphaeria bacterium]|nr:peptide deformylase [Lentisphaeria bacterium]